MTTLNNFDEYTDDEDDDEDYEDEEEEDDTERFNVPKYVDRAGNTWTRKRDIQFAMEAEENGLEVRSYSGRCMYGRECPAIVGDDLAELYRATTVKDLRQDSMGLSVVVYPG